MYCWVMHYIHTELGQSCKNEQECFRVITALYISIDDHFSLCALTLLCPDLAFGLLIDVYKEVHDDFYCTFLSVHEKTLIQALEMLSLWCSKFSNEVPSKIMDWFKV